MSWQLHAQRLAEQVTHPISRWRPIIAAVPRHLFIPRWWSWASPGSGYGTDTFALADGPGNRVSWLKNGYCDRSLVTQVGRLHADHASPADRPAGLPSSSATLPSLIVQLLRHAMIDDGMEILDIGSGYGTAVLTTCDATGPLPGSYDRIVATVAVRPIPVSWLRALRPGGRLVTTIAGTTLILTADKTDDGGATGRIEWDRAGFMPTRSGPDYPPILHPLLDQLRDADGDDISTGRYPVINIVEAWELCSTLGIQHPGIEHHYEHRDGARTAFMLHADGSWAKATSRGDDPPIIHLSRGR